MASSRWKRFAFFERHTLNLPNDVLQDIINPLDNGNNNNNNNNTNSNTNSSGSSDNTATSKSSSIRTTLAAGPAAAATTLQQEKDDAVRLVVTTAGLPLTSRNRIGISPMSSSTTRSSTTTTGSSSSNRDQTTQDNTLDDLHVVNAMWSSLTACSSPGLAFSTPSVAAAPAATATATATATGGEDAPHVQSSMVDAAPPVRLLKKSGGEKTTTTSNNTAASSMDGLVLAFLTSRETQLVHCVDVTVRCNPPPILSSSLSSSLKNSATDNVDTQQQQQQQQPQQKRLQPSFEDMDGWRGYFSPFGAAAGEGMSSSSTSTDNNNAITDIAACRVLVGGGGDDGDYLALHLACLSRHSLVVWEDPHLHLSCRRPFHPKQPKAMNNASAVTTTTTTGAAAIVYSLPKGTTTTSSSWNSSVDGTPRVVSIAPGMVAVGTDTAAVLVYCYNYLKNQSVTAGGNTNRQLRRYLKIPPPPSNSSSSSSNEGDRLEVVSVKLCLGKEKASVFVAYHRHQTTATAETSQMSSATAGLCCYDMPLPSATSATTTTNTTLTAPLARHDLDGRYTGSDSLVDSYVIGGNSGGRGSRGGLQVTVARPDGLYTYSQTEKIGVAPIDGSKLAIALIPPPFPAEKKRSSLFDDEEENNTADPSSSADDTAHNNTVGSGYALVASTDEKSGRDAVDIYDVTNKLVAFHLLLSPGHRAVRAAGVTTFPSICSDGSIKGGRSSALVLTSGGTLTSLTEKLTQEKVTLLVQKNLYSAAVRVAYADPSFAPASITTLYRRYAEHLYRKGDFGAAMDQYIHTIGSLETSHVIFRYLDAPKIPLLVKYLERLHARNLATSVHNELLRTCYLKLNDTEAAEAIASQSTINKASLTSILSNLSNTPKEALSTICALEAEQVAEILVIHGASLARVLPKETAGVVIALCVGTYSPQALAGVNSTDVKRMVEYATDDRRPKACEPYNVELFASAFIEQPKNLRLILAHCNRNKCPLSPSLRRTLLELTLMEWNQAKRTGDTELQKLRHKEAIAALTDSHCQEIGDYDALVIVQLAGYEEGELLLYERLQMTPVLLERYAKDGSEKARRQMLALAQTDAELLAEILGHFVAIASEKLNNNKHPEGGENEKQTNDASYDDDDSDGHDEVEAILEDIQEALALARRHGVLPPVRIARILAGEGTGQFSTHDIPSGSSVNENGEVQHRKTVPLSVALDYVGSILEDSRKELDRLRNEVEEYNQLCNSMESEIDSLNCFVPPAESMANRRMNIDELYTRIRSEDDDAKDNFGLVPREAFWRDMNQSEDSFDTIARFFAKGVIR